MDPLLGTIIAFAGNFAPVGWIMCNGQTLTIAQNAALYAILGTTYGGDGRTTFAVPNLNGRMIVGGGSGPGGSYAPGQQGGAAAVTLTTQQMPAHTHAAQCIVAKPASNTPAGNMLSNSGTTDIYVSPSTGTPTAMAQQAIGQTGGGQQVNTISPFTCINYIMATQGVFPQRP